MIVEGDGSDFFRLDGDQLRDVRSLHPGSDLVR